MRSAAAVLALLGPACGSGNPYAEYWPDADAWPTLQAASPAEAESLAGGAEVTLTGERLGSTQTVLFGGRNAEVLSVSDSAVTVRLPDGPPGGGPVDVGLVTDDGATWLEQGFHYGALGADWWADEVGSAALYRVDCPIEFWRFDDTVGDWESAWWCGIELGYADAYGWAGAGRQPGLAGDLAGIAELGALPAPGQVRVFEPGQRRPPLPPQVYGTHPAGEAWQFSSPRDLARDLAFIDAREALVERTYTWADYISEWTGPLAFLYDDEQCYAGSATVLAAEGARLSVDGADSADGLALGFGLVECYDARFDTCDDRDDPGDLIYYAYEAPTASAWITDGGDPLTLGPTGVTVVYDPDYGYYFAEGPAGALVHPGDLPAQATLSVTVDRLGEAEALGAIETAPELVLLRPDLLTGDQELDRSRDLTVTWEAHDGVGDDPAPVVIDLRVYDADLDDPNWLTEVARLVAHADDASGTFTIPAAELQRLPAAANDLDDEGDLVGLWAELTVARHQLRKLPWQDGDLVIDLTHAVNSPVVLK